ncbi:uncharacterized protein B4U79_11838 [Dinothrombium tinctorium]|uniref:Chitin-binding type-4 domain-containing protein n=1 Tax=Dinothrombium tinctorium TaxID=1965070 RepID=A0A3S3PEY3_9ACAR|nr:uncharacterized protein B4U79_11838 [Dinothrombium tinctorium]
MWRKGYEVPANYNDNELSCGRALKLSFQIEPWKNNPGCGVCGDPIKGPRHNEFPNGKYAKNPVAVEHYTSESNITVEVMLTTNHRGFFLFKICSADGRREEVTQECLDSNPLEVLDENQVKGKYKYMVKAEQSKMIKIRLKLPAITCDRCVLQWDYRTGNNWGKCPDGSYSNDCGAGETFRSYLTVHYSVEIEKNDDVW